MTFLNKFFKKKSKTRKYILEHEILRVLYEKGVLIVKSHGNITDGRQAIFKKVYENSSFHFGTLVDILNNPQKYHDSRYQMEELILFKNKKLQLKKL